MNYNINFPHLHIYLDHVGKSIDIFGFSIAYYGIVIAIGMVLGTLLARAVAKRTGQDPDMYVSFAIMAIIISVICARLYYVVFSWDLYKDNLISILNIRQGGLAIYGGVIGGIISAIIFAAIKKVRLGTLLDTACLGLLVGQILGRWGNFFNREAFGGYTDSLFAMQLPVDAVRSVDITNELASHMQVVDGISYIQVHPTFLYECVWNIVVLIILLARTKHKRFEGAIFFGYLVGYGLGRAWIEGLRTDQLLIPGTQFAVSQLLSIGLVVFGIIAIIIGRGIARVKAKKKQ
ncbi:MAG: prolipoprotein diacylglyceryl transferase [Eubacterium sp.]|nr:prolipoprotein diacylglyceryl transferase [Eubacterium sp.]MBQ9022374.1 prolipoprotein diacylglyceryl transferase [Eubacterium sp.]